MSTSFGDTLRLARKQAGLSQAELAERIGYSLQHISNLERNARIPDPEIVRERMITALELAVDSPLALRIVDQARRARGLSMNATWATAAAFEQLPAAPSRLIGRGQELRAAENAMQDSTVRMLTLIGPPGVGKTRLSLALAERYAPLFRDGACFVSLAHATDAMAAAHALLVALRAPINQAQLPTQAVIDALRDKDVLIVLDNLEQIADAGPAVSELLARCRGVRLIGTSRKRLLIRAEHVLRVPPLAPPEAVEMLFERVSAFTGSASITPDDAARLCAMLDCLPLNIELAVPLLENSTPTAVIAALANHGRIATLNNGPVDAPARQQSLQAALDWSYHCLDALQQRVLAWISVFSTGFSVADLQELLCDVPAEEVAEAVRQLRRQNLIGALQSSHAA